MKKFLPALLLMLCSFSYPQKYVLIDKKMALPLSYTNTVTIEHSYKNLFAVEHDKIHQFVTEVEKIAANLTDKKSKPEAIDFKIGQTHFFGVKVPLTTEERLDVVLTTNCDGTKIMMHLCDAKLSNANNAFFITTWVKYIKSNLK
ncbi:MAG: hypothetical protein M3004_00890 [Bacteroidota bacterium]|nr:hypothetical protein [Bacteroidota bacterium]